MVDVLDHDVAAALEPQHREPERPAVAQRALDLDLEALRHLVDGGELAPARGDRRRDDDDDRADRDDVAGGDEARARDRRAVQRRAVPAPEILDEDLLALAAHDRVAARHGAIVDDDRAVGVAAERDLGAVGERDDPRVLVRGDDEVPRARARPGVDDRPQPGRAVGDGADLPSLRYAAPVKLAVLAAIACAHAQPAPKPVPSTQPLAIGETFTLDSHVLGEKRVINVYLPPDYDKSGARYPVLYMPDGGVKEDFPHVTGSVDVSIKDEVIRPLIVVGIENTERRRDLVGPTDVAEEHAAAPHAGGSDKFREFLRDELKPAIAKRYRTTVESALIGESLAGLFVVETLVVEPALFDTYISVDPSVWWNKQSLVHAAAEKFTPMPNKRLFIATADYKETQEAVAVLLAAIGDRIPVRYEPMPDEHHNTIYGVAAVRAIRFLFAIAPAPAAR